MISRVKGWAGKAWAVLKFLWVAIRAVFVFLKRAVVATGKGIYAVATWEVTVFGVFAWAYGIYLAAMAVTYLMQSPYDIAYSSAACGYFVGVLWYGLYFLNQGTYTKTIDFFKKIADDGLDIARVALEQNTRLREDLAEAGVRSDPFNREGLIKSLQDFRNKHGKGKGDDYWNGVADIVESFY